MHTDRAACAAAVRSRDPRFDGWFFTGVSSTRIYCRPSCPAMTPREQHMRFFPSAAAAQGAGYRACKRCRPDAVPGSPQWHHRADVVARAVRLIADGVVDTDGVAGLAQRLGYSSRQLERLVAAELGAGPIALARAQRAQTALILIETTDLTMGEIAFAAGFSSVRSFNDTVRAVFAATPTGLREHRGRVPVPRSDRTGAGGTPATAHRIVVRLAHRMPLHADGLFGHLAATLVPGVERWHAGGLERTLRLPHAPGRVHLCPADGHVVATLTLLDLRDLTRAIHRCRALLDLDADPVAVDERLGTDRDLAPLVRRHPGARIPGTVDPAEMAVRVVLGQQISTRAASTLASRIVHRMGEPLPGPLLAGAPDGTPDRLFPSAEVLAEESPEGYPGMPSARLRTVRTLAAEVAGGGLRLGPDTSWEHTRTVLHGIPGVGPWTVEMIALRALADPDAFPATDLAVRASAAANGLPGESRALIARSLSWRPWRAYAVQNLWSASDHEAARMPLAGQPEERP